MKPVWLPCRNCFPFLRVAGAEEGGEAEARDLSHHFESDAHIRPRDERDFSDPVLRLTLYCKATGFNY